MFVWVFLFRSAYVFPLVTVGTNYSEEHLEYEARGVKRSATAALCGVDGLWEDQIHMRRGAHAPVVAPPPSFPLSPFALPSFLCSVPASACTNRSPTAPHHFRLRDFVLIIFVFVLFFKETFEY